jgi:membrane protease YdiL (CAAX protease family)
VTPTPKTPSPARRGLIVLAAAVALVVAMRLRGHVPAVVAFHNYLASLGVPAAVRRFDATLVLLAAAFGGAAWLARGGPRGACATLGLAGPVLPSLRFTALASLPMFVAGALVGDGPTASLDLVPGVLVAPFVEEVVYRGLLVAAVHRAGGVGFGLAATVSAVLFGAGHVSWSAAPGLGDALVFLVTGAGGAWFAWLLRARGFVLADTVALHAAMNLAWMVFGVAENAVGGVVANVGRAATVAFTIVATRRALRRDPVRSARPPSGPRVPPPGIVDPVGPSRPPGSPDVPGRPPGRPR